MSCEDSSQGNPTPSLQREQLLCDNGQQSSKVPTADTLSLSTILNVNGTLEAKPKPENQYHSHSFLRCLVQRLYHSQSKSVEAFKGQLFFQEWVSNL